VKKEDSKTGSNGRKKKEEGTSKGEEKGKDSDSECRVWVGLPGKAEGDILLGCAIVCRKG